ncbi:MAG TPA: wax ester/triacylglycerol synthase family O-acyltransferase [Solirubrobacteraceae bacterium]|jgi:WS/DGAT/MGAT family acyltransferase|nr:wax ester/triacylglycerol synthase family O-acyltransferase [Solirubrobacteraceae bacterium]
MEWMSAIDSSFLHVENDVTPMHIGGVSIFAGPAPPFEDLRAMVSGKLGIVPRYRQKVRFVPLGAGSPVWVEDPHFSLDYHLRHSALPSPGSEQQLRQMAARVFSQHLDRNKPLWELWMVEGLDRGRWALLSKVHHCMVDGEAATDLMSVMFSDTTATDSQRPWAPEPEPSSIEVLARTLARRASPAGQLESVRAALQAPRQTLASLTEVVRAAAAASPNMRLVEGSSLIGPIGPHRRWSWADVRLADVKAVRAGLGGTVNDVVLTVITNGFRALLDSRGEEVAAERVVRTMVPVSVRRRGERGVYNNRVSAVFASLPVGIDDPRERLESIRAEMDGVKDSKQAVAGDVLASLSGFAPPLLLALGSRLVTSAPRLNMHTATTNVPGPQEPVQTLGRRMLESYPFVPVVGSIRIVVAIFSYDGGLYFGVTGDYDGAPDIDVLTDGIAAGMSDLLALVPPPSRARVAAKPARPPRKRRPAATP